jgi:hypothetical protein
MESVFNSDFVKSSAGKLDEVFGTNLFAKSADAAANYFGNTVGDSLDGLKEKIQDTFKTNDMVFIGGVQESIADIDKAWSDYTATIEADQNMFIDIQEQLVKEGEEAERLGIKIGDLEDHKLKLAKADLEAAEAAKRLSDAEAERLERIRVLERQSTIGDGKGSLERMSKAMDIVAEAKGKVDPTAASINKLNKDMKILQSTMNSAPDDAKKMAKAIEGLNVKLVGQRAALAKLQVADAGGEYGILTQEVNDTLSSIEALSLGLKEQPEHMGRLAEAWKILAEAKAELSKTDTQKALDKLNEGFDQTIKYTDRLISHYKILGDAEEEAAVRAAILADANDEQIKALRAKLAEVKKFNAEMDFTETLDKSLKAMLDGFGGLGDDIVKGVAQGDWSGLGDSIGSILGDAVSTILGKSLSTSLFSSLGALAGPLGSLLGGIVGSVIQGVISGDLFGEVEDPTDKLQAKLGTGGVLGDTTKKTEAIANSLDMIEDTNAKILGVNTGMLQALRSLRQDISKGAALVARATPEAQAGINAPSVGNVLDTKGGVGLAGSLAMSSITGAQAAIFTGGLSLLSSFNGFAGKVGEFANDTVNVLTLGLFNKLGDWLGGSSKKVDEGVIILGGAIGDLVNNTVSQAYATFRVKDWAGDKGSLKTQTNPFNEVINNQLGLIFQDINDSVVATAQGLGLNMSEIKAALATFEVADIKISTEGLSTDELTKAWETAFGDVFDNLSEHVLPFVKDFAQIGESFGDTATRLSTELSLVNEAFASIGITMETMGDLYAFPKFLGVFGEAMAGVAIPAELLLKAADDLVNAVGGVEAFSDALAGFEANFLSEADNFANLGRRLGTAMGDLPLPETRDGFVALMKAQNGLDAQSIQNRATMLQLQGAADGYYDTLEDWSDRISDAFLGMTGTEIDATSLADYLAQVKAGTITIDELTASMTANVAATQGMADIQSLTLRLQKLTMSEADFLNLTRMNEIDSMRELGNATEAINLLTLIYAEEDLAKQTEETAKAEEALTVARLDATNAAIDAFYKIGFQAFNADGLALTGEQITEAASNLVNGVGDLASFNEAVNTFSTNFITAEAKLSASTNKLTSKFAEFGLEVPATREGFTALMQSLNAMNASGQIGISTMLTLTAAADDYYKNQEALASRMFDLDLRLLRAQGKESEALSKTRQKELDSVTDTEKAILLQIYAAEDLNTMREDELSIQDQLTDVKDRLNASYRDEISNLEGVRDTMRGLGDSLRDFGTELSLGDLSSLSPQDQLARARKEFDLTASAAQSGDESALGRLQAVSQAFLNESREFQGSGGTFAQDFAKVQEVISNSASVADLQASQAERQRVLLEKQLQRQEENNAETRSIKEALLALIAVQRETGVLSLSELNAIGASLSILESNSSLSTSQL